MAVDQKTYYDKTLKTVKSCTNALQLPAAERIVFQYDSLSWVFEASDSEYDHEWHIYTLLAELTSKKKQLLQP